MKSLLDFKPQLQNALKPYAGSIAARGITPNFVSLAGLLLAAVSGLIVSIFHDSQLPLLILAAAFLLRAVLCLIDGMIARATGQATPGGRLLSEIADVAGDMLLCLPLLLVPDFSPFLVVLVVILAVLTEVAGIAAASIGVGRRHDGPMGRLDRAAALALLALLAGFGLLPAAVLNLALAVIVGLAFLTIINRVNGALEAHAALKEETPGNSGLSGPVT